jgi:hypothetical protein
VPEWHLEARVAGLFEAVSNLDAFGTRVGSARN